MALIQAAKNTTDSHLLGTSRTLKINAVRQAIAESLTNLKSALVSLIFLLLTLVLWAKEFVQCSGI